jgi:isopenicillin-N N-acyltransferase-like protein
VRAEGSHRELGQQHGAQAAEEIRAHLDYIGHRQELSRQQLRTKALRFKPLFERHCPHLLTEIEGLGEGAGVPLAEALAVNIRGELGKATDEGCTTYVLGRKSTASGEILIGQNSDMMQSNLEMGYVLHLKPVDKPQVLIWTYGGMIGYHGMNSAGVAHFANAFGGGPPGQFALPHGPVKRLMLECTELSEVLEIFDKVPLASNGNYVVCDGGGKILDIEATTRGPRLLRDHDAGFLAHSNHFLCAPYASQENYAKSMPDSFDRLDRINKMILTAFGSITVESMQRYLSDHSNHPTSICRHPRTTDLEKGFEVAGRTVASMIAEPAHRRMHVALGNPCESRFVTYSMDA